MKETHGKTKYFMKSYHFLTLILIMCIHPSTLSAQVFNDYFTDATLRLDYIFAGDASKQEISIDELHVMPRWYGKRKHLSEVPMRGNGQIIVNDHATGQVIYRNSFSTLFQEWLSYPEANTTRKSFQNVFLAPMPKDTVDVTVELYDNRQNTMSKFTHQVVPSDILIRRTGWTNVTPFETLQTAKDTTNCIHIAYLAEGYKDQEMDVFLNDCKEAMEALFSHEPFKSLRDRFNIIAVKSPSLDSGTSVPRDGIWKNTALHSHFDTFYSQRYLTTLHLKNMHDWLAGTPYEHIIVLVNTDLYGGGGILNSYNLSMTHHRQFKPVVVHEFGHSFAGLGDEYAYESEEVPMYPHDVEPWEPNLTTLSNFNDKWEDLIEKDTPIPTPLSTDSTVIKNRIGIYEGAGYSTKGVYRGCQDCRMRTNENPIFCPICDRAIRKTIYFYTE